jgi:hypothetical protein
MSGRPSRCNTRLDCDPWWASLTRGAVRSVSYGLVGRLTSRRPGSRCQRHQRPGMVQQSAKFSARSILLFDRMIHTL